MWFESNWISRIQKLNNSNVIYNLGFLYEEGHGAKHNLLKSIEYYERSAKLHNSKALYNLVLLYLEGQRPNKII